ncbi:MAG: hypothetical protein ACPHXR_06435 [Flavicella sp.]
MIKIEKGADKFANKSNVGCKKTHTNAKEILFVIEYTSDYVLDQTETAIFTIAAILTDEKITEATSASSTNRTLTMTITG